MRVPVSVSIESSPAATGPALLRSGHRPFFLLAGLYAVVAMGLWLAAWSGHAPLTMMTMSWHGHEMIFGFAVAAVAGFLTAAVPKWTGSAPFAGPIVPLLVAVWLLGRVAMVFAPIAWLDLIFLPLLAVLVAHRVIVARNKRNYQVPALLIALAALNAMTHFGPPSQALRVAVHIVVALVALIAGRIIPAFTSNALSQAGKSVKCTTPRWLDVLAVPAVVAVALAEWFAPGTLWNGAIALFAAAVLAVRMVGWKTVETRHSPILWILHAAYLWLPIGLGLEGAIALGLPWNPYAALHALTAGAIGTMILAVASRAALGHSGRPLKVSKATTAAYVLVLLAAAVRVALPGTHAVWTSGLLWMAGFGLFSYDYAPILTRPRIDGRPG
mgnify:CR=1 FL=1